MLAVFIYFVLPSILLILGLPIFLVLLVTCLVAVLSIADVPTEAVQTYLFGGLDNFPLLAVPFFVFAGEIMAQGGIARRIVAWVVAIIGGIRGSVAEIKAWLPVALARFPKYYHMVATTKLELAGDAARARTCLFNPMVYRDDEGRESVFFIGLWYRDRLVRTPAGWRIVERYEEMGYAHNVPDMPPVPTVGQVTGVP